jgi:hypothetical protein
MRHTIIFPSRLLLAAFLLTASGCSGPTDDGGVAVRDSAGVRIIENSTPVWADGNGWCLSDAPLVGIGVEDGPDEYQLFRVSSATRFDDGRIAVANAGTNELRFFDETGGFLFARGGDGEGPGEFRRMRGIWRLADSLFLYDIGLARITVYSGSGEFIRVFRLGMAPDGAIVLPWGVLGNLGFLVQRSPLNRELGTGLYRDTSLYLRYSLEGEYVDTVGYYVGTERYYGGMGDQKYAAPAPFARVTHLAPHGERFYLGTSTSYEIGVLAADGTVEQVIRRLVPNRPITAEEAEDHYASLRERLPGMSDQWRALYSKMTLPDLKPAYGRLVADAEGNLWVAEYGDESTWTVFDTAGRMLGPVAVPAGGRVLEIGRDYVLGVWQDEWEVERVLVYGLSKA